VSALFAGVSDSQHVLLRTAVWEVFKDSECKTHGMIQSGEPLAALGTFFKKTTAFTAPGSGGRKSCMS